MPSLSLCWLSSCPGQLSFDSQTPSPSESSGLSSGHGSEALQTPSVSVSVPSLPLSGGPPVTEQSSQASLSASTQRLGSRGWLSAVSTTVSLSSSASQLSPSPSPSSSCWFSLATDGQLSSVSATSSPSSSSSHSSPCPSSSISVCCGLSSSGQLSSESHTPSLSRSSRSSSGQGSQSSGWPSSSVSSVSSPCSQTSSGSQTPSPSASVALHRTSTQCSNALQNRPASHGLSSSQSSPNFPGPTSASASDCPASSLPPPSKPLSAPLTPLSPLAPAPPRPPAPALLPSSAPPCPLPPRPASDCSGPNSYSPKSLMAVQFDPTNKKTRLNKQNWGGLERIFASPGLELAGTKAASRRARRRPISCRGTVAVPRRPLRLESKADVTRRIPQEIADVFRS